LKTSMNLISINIGMILLRLCDLIIVPPATLRFAYAHFGATALGQQVDMWLRFAHPNLLRLRSANFTYPQNVIGNPFQQRRRFEKCFIMLELPKNLIGLMMK